MGVSRKIAKRTVQTGRQGMRSEGALTKGIEARTKGMALTKCAQKKSTGGGTKGTRKSGLEVERKAPENVDWSWYERHGVHQVRSENVDWRWNERHDARQIRNNIAKWWKLARALIQYALPSGGNWHERS